MPHPTLTLRQLREQLDGTSAQASADACANPELVEQVLAARLGDLVEQLEYIADLGWSCDGDDDDDAPAAETEDRRSVTPEQRAWWLVTQAREREGLLGVLREVVHVWSDEAVRAQLRREARRERLAARAAAAAAAAAGARAAGVRPADADLDDAGMEDEQEGEERDDVPALVRRAAVRAANTLFRDPGEGLVGRLLTALTSLHEADEADAADPAAPLRGTPAHREAVSSALRRHTRRLMLLEMLLWVFRARPCSLDTFAALARFALRTHLSPHRVQLVLLVDAVGKEVASTLGEQYRGLGVLVLLQALALSRFVPQPLQLYGKGEAPRLLLHPLLPFGPGALRPLLDIADEFAAVAVKTLTRDATRGEMGMMADEAGSGSGSASAPGPGPGDGSAAARGAWPPPGLTSAAQHNCALELAASNPLVVVTVALAAVVQLHLARCLAAENAEALAESRHPDDDEIELSSVVVAAAAASRELAPTGEADTAPGHGGGASGAGGIAAGRPAGRGAVEDAVQAATRFVSPEVLPGFDDVYHPVNLAASARFLTTALESLSVFVPASFMPEAFDAGSVAGGAAAAWRELEAELSLASDGPDRAKAARERGSEVLRVGEESGRGSDDAFVGPDFDAQSDALACGDLVGDAAAESARAGGSLPGHVTLPTVDLQRTVGRYSTSKADAGLAQIAAEVSYDFVVAVIRARMHRPDPLASRTRPLPSPFAEPARLGGRSGGGNGGPSAAVDPNRPHPVGRWELDASVELLAASFRVNVALVEAAWQGGQPLEQVPVPAPEIAAVLRAARLLYPMHDPRPLYRLAAAMFTDRVPAEYMAYCLDTVYTFTGVGGGAAPEPRAGGTDVTMGQLCEPFDDEEARAVVEAHMDVAPDALRRAYEGKDEEDGTLTFGARNEAEERGRLACARLPLRVGDGGERAPERCLPVFRTRTFSFPQYGTELSASGNTTGFSVLGGGESQVVVWLHTHSVWGVVAARLRTLALQVLPENARKLALIDAVLRGVAVSRDDAASVLGMRPGILPILEELTDTAALLSSALRFASSATDFGAHAPYGLIPRMIANAIEAQGRAHGLKRPTDVEVIEMLASAAGLLVVQLLPLAHSAALGDVAGVRLFPELRALVRAPARAAVDLLVTLTTKYTEVVAPLLLRSAAATGAGAADAYSVSSLSSSSSSSPSPSSSSPSGALPAGFDLFRALSYCLTSVDGPTRRFELTLPLMRAAGEVVRYVLRRRACLDFSAAFSRFDSDGGGTISIEEFREALERLGVPLKGAALMSLIKELDRDGSRSVDYEEFVRFALARAHRGEAALLAARPASSSGAGGGGGGGGYGGVDSGDDVEREIVEFIQGLTQTSPAQVVVEHAVLSSALDSAVRCLLVSIAPIGHLGAQLMLQIRALGLLNTMLRSKGLVRGVPVGDEVCALLLARPQVTHAVLTVLHQIPLAAARIQRGKLFAEVGEAIRGIRAEKERAVREAGTDAAKRQAALEAEEKGIAAERARLPEEVKLPLDFAELTGHMSLADHELARDATLLALNVLNRLFLHSGAASASTAAAVDEASAASGADATEYLAEVKARLVLSYKPSSGAGESAASRQTFDAMDADEARRERILLAVPLNPVAALASLIGYTADAHADPNQHSAWGQHVSATARGTAKKEGAAGASQSSFNGGHFGYSSLGHIAPACISTAALTALTLLTRCMSAAAREVEKRAEASEGGGAGKAARMREEDGGRGAAARGAGPASSFVAGGLFPSTGSDATAASSATFFDLQRYLGGVHADGMRRILFGTGSEGATIPTVPDTVLLGALRFARALFDGQGAMLSVVLVRDFELLKLGSIATAVTKEGKEKEREAERGRVARRWQRPSLLGLVLDVIRAACPVTTQPVLTKRSGGSTSASAPRLVAKGLLDPQVGGTVGPQLVVEALAVVAQLWRSACEAGVHVREVSELRLQALDETFWHAVTDIARGGAGDYEASAVAAGSRDFYRDVEFPVRADDLENLVYGSLSSPTPGRACAFNVHAVRRHAYVVTARALALQVLAAGLSWQRASLDPAASRCRQAIEVLLLARSSTDGDADAAVAASASAHDVVDEGWTATVGEDLLHSALLPEDVRADKTKSPTVPPPRPLLQLLLTGATVDICSFGRLASLARSAADDDGISLAPYRTSRARVSFPAFASYGPGSTASSPSTDASVLGVRRTAGEGHVRHLLASTGAGNRQPWLRYGIGCDFDVGALAADLGLEDAFVHMLSAVSVHPPAARRSDGMDGDGDDDFAGGDDEDGAGPSSRVGSRGEGIGDAVYTTSGARKEKLDTDAAVLWAAALQGTASSLLQAQRAQLQSLTAFLALLPLARLESPTEECPGTLHLHAASIVFSRLAIALSGDSGLGVGQDALADLTMLEAANEMAASGTALLQISLSAIASGCPPGFLAPGDADERVRAEKLAERTERMERMFRAAYRCVVGVLLALRRNQLQPGAVAGRSLTVQPALHLLTTLLAAALTLCGVLIPSGGDGLLPRQQWKSNDSIQIMAVVLELAQHAAVAMQAARDAVAPAASASPSALSSSSASFALSPSSSRRLAAGVPISSPGSSEAAAAAAAAFATQEAASRLYATASSLLIVLLRDNELRLLLGESADEAAMAAASASSARGAAGGVGSGTWGGAASGGPGASSSALGSSSFSSRSSFASSSSVVLAGIAPSGPAAVPLRASLLPTWLADALVVARDTFCSASAAASAALAKHEDSWVATVRGRLAVAQRHLDASRAFGVDPAIRHAELGAAASTFSSLKGQAAALPPAVASEVNSAATFALMSLRVMMQIAALGDDGGESGEAGVQPRMGLNGAGAHAVVALGIHEALLSNPLFVRVEMVLGERLQAGLDAYAAPSRGDAAASGVLTPKGRPTAHPLLTSSPGAVGLSVTGLSALHADLAAAGADPRLAFAASGFGLGPAESRGYRGADSERCALGRLWPEALGLLTVLLRMPAGGHGPDAPQTAVAAGLVRASCAALAEYGRLTLHTALAAHPSSLTLAGCEEATAAAHFLASLYSLREVPLAPGQAAKVGLAEEGMRRLCISPFSHWKLRVGSGTGAAAAAAKDDADPPAGTLPGAAPTLAAYALRNAILLLGLLSPSIGAPATRRRRGSGAGMGKGADGSSGGGGGGGGGGDGGDDVWGGGAAEGSANSAASASASGSDHGGETDWGISLDLWKRSCGVGSGGWSHSLVAVSPQERALEDAGHWHEAQDTLGPADYPLGHLAAACARLCSTAQGTALSLESRRKAAAAKAKADAARAAAQSQSRSTTEAMSEADSLAFSRIMAQAVRDGQKDPLGYARGMLKLEKERSLVGGSGRSSAAAAHDGGGSGGMDVEAPTSPSFAPGDSLVRALFESQAQMSAVVAPPPVPVSRSGAAASAASPPGDDWPSYAAAFPPAVVPEGERPSPVLYDAAQRAVTRTRQARAAARSIAGVEARRAEAGYTAESSAMLEAEIERYSASAGAPRPHPLLPFSRPDGLVSHSVDARDAEPPRPGLVHLACALDFALKQSEQLRREREEGRGGAVTWTTSAASAALRALAAAREPAVAGDAAAGTGGGEGGPAEQLDETPGGASVGDDGGDADGDEDGNSRGGAARPSALSELFPAPPPRMDPPELAGMLRHVLGLLAHGTDVAAQGGRADTAYARSVEELVVKSVGDGGALLSVLDIFHEVDAALAHRLDPEGAGGAGRSVADRSQYSRGTGGGGGGTTLTGTLLGSLPGTLAGMGSGAGGTGPVSAISAHTRVWYKLLQTAAEPYLPARWGGNPRKATEGARRAEERTLLLKDAVRAGGRGGAMHDDTTSASARSSDLFVDAAIAGIVCTLSARYGVPAGAVATSLTAADSRAPDPLTAVLSGSWRHERLAEEEKDDRDEVKPEDRRRLTRESEGGRSGDFTDLFSSGRGGAGAGSGSGGVGRRRRSRSRSKSIGRAGGWGATSPRSPR
jgi:hypothetical protein